MAWQVLLRSHDLLTSAQLGESCETMKMLRSHLRLRPKERCEIRESKVEGCEIRKVAKSCDPLIFANNLIKSGNREEISETLFQSAEKEK